MTHERTSARSGPRVEVSLAAVLIPRDPQDDAIPVTTIDLGPGGALCESELSAPLGGAYSFRIALPGRPGETAETLALPATVVRVEGEGPFTIALQFATPPKGIVEVLKRYLWRARAPTRP